MIDPQDIAEGTDVEMEHTTDRAVARQIAMDHLREDPDYYRKLRIVESPWFSMPGLVIGVVVVAGVAWFLCRSKTP